MVLMNLLKNISKYQEDSETDTKDACLVESRDGEGVGERSGNGVTALCPSRGAGRPCSLGFIKLCT